jgi:guanylate kinase
MTLRVHRPFLIVLSSPSGAGKTSIVRGLLARDKSLVHSVSATTRTMRPGEVHSRDYFFWSPARFAAKRRSGQLLESALVYDHWYGTPKTPVLKALRQGHDVIADVDVQGAESIRRLLPDAVTIFVTAPDPGAVEQRLRNRNTDSAEEISKRLAHMPAELEERSQFDYQVVNRVLEQAIDDVDTIIRAERLSTSRFLVHGS